MKQWQRQSETLTVPANTHHFVKYPNLHTHIYNAYRKEKIHPLALVAAELKMKSFSL